MVFADASFVFLFLPLIASIAFWSWSTSRWLERRQGKQRRHALWMAIA
jgi:hypothetical protein